MRPLDVINFGARLVPYAYGLKLQELLARRVQDAACNDTLVLLQHSPVYTLGKRGDKHVDFKVPLEDLQARGVDIHVSPRGGQTTYHGPGQLVAYPVVSLRRAGRGARAWVEGLEDTIISTLGAHGVRAEGRIPGATGVWVQDRKIAAIGVRISHGVSTHGLALNIHTDLSAYDVIVPCGISDKAVTSLAQEVQASGFAAITTERRDRELSREEHAPAQAGMPCCAQASRQGISHADLSVTERLPDVESVLYHIHQRHHTQQNHDKLQGLSMHENHVRQAAGRNCLSAASELHVGHDLGVHESCSLDSSSGSNRVNVRDVSLERHTELHDERLILPTCKHRAFHQVSLAFVEKFCQHFGYSLSSWTDVERVT